MVKRFKQVDSVFCFLGTNHGDEEKGIKHRMTDDNERRWMNFIKYWKVHRPICPKMYYSTSCAAHTPLLWFKLFYWTERQLMYKGKRSQLNGRYTKNISIRFTRNITLDRVRSLNFHSNAVYFRVCVS